jgi:protein-L-isoaspartate(D-aspartate) O-methyltransferase
MEPELSPVVPDPADSEFEEARADLVREVARQTGVTDEAILNAFDAVPRHRFVPAERRSQAYVDRALPIGAGQTISQPSMIAIMLAELDLQPTDRVLEIGAGSGYAAALLARLASSVYAVEIVPELARRARALLAELAIDNVELVEGNGRFGYPERAPYDKILVSAAAEEVPPELLAELSPGGRIVMPVGDELGQELVIGDKDARGHVEWRRTIACIFVPLIAN